VILTYLPSDVGEHRGLRYWRSGRDPTGERLGGVGGASSNPATAPVHTYHLGLWFNSPQDAVKAGGPDTVTPFNGEHNAGVRVLNTSNFPDLEGPLINVK
jgi:hypothetical protein